jgi:hypothetical protein
MCRMGLAGLHSMFVLCAPWVVSGSDFVTLFRLQPIVAASKLQNSFLLEGRMCVSHLNPSVPCLVLTESTDSPVQSTKKDVRPFIMQLPRIVMCVG